MARAQRVMPSPEKIDAFRQTMADLGKTPDEVEGEVEAMLGDDGAEIWVNRHVVCKLWRDPSDGSVGHIHVRRQDRKPLRDWRMMQRIKNELAGPEVEAFELYPAESRLVDSANSYWIWCMKPGVRLPVGFEHREVNYDEELARRVGAKQRRETL